MVYTSDVHGIPVQTGDIICTKDGGSFPIAGQIWRLIGQLIPGEVDHAVVYIGPGGRCIEAGAKMKVAEFEIPDRKWDVPKMIAHRGPLIDSFYGVAYPLQGREGVQGREAGIREAVAAYCVAQLGKPYNFIFPASGREDTFYCSQLAYKAYLSQGIDLNTGIGIPGIPGTGSIIFPHEIWLGCEHTKY
jgi:hypothetical protein